LYSGFLVAQSGSRIYTTLPDDYPTLRFNLYEYR
jgi:hypothetical protein